jgi:hypothetical protein
MPPRQQHHLPVRVRAPQPRPRQHRLAQLGHADLPRQAQAPLGLGSPPTRARAKTARRAATGGRERQEASRLDPFSLQRPPLHIAYRSTSITIRMPINTYRESGVTQFR